MALAWLVASVLTIGAMHGAHAQARPDAGALQQQIERDRMQSLPPGGGLERPVAPPPALAAPAGGATVTVTSFRFAGNRLIDGDELAQVVSEYLNRPLTFADLQQAAAAVANAYREAGWIVRAYLPRQDISGGVVTIQIVEAVFGGMRIEGEKPSRESFYHVEDMIDYQQKLGEPLNADTLDRALLLASDLPAVTVAGSLEEGGKPGETALALKFTDKPLMTGDGVIDNTGSRSTGRNRFAGNLYLNSPFSRGELFTANYIHSQSSDRLTSDGSDYIRLAASVPLGLDGARVGLNSSYMHYTLITPEYDALDANGTSATVGLEASYPLIRSRLLNLFLNANIDHKAFNNYSLDTVTSRYMSDSLTLTLSGNLFDKLGGGGANNFSLAFTSGLLNLDGSANKAADAATTRTAGNYNKIRFSLSRQQAITEELSAYLAYSGQAAAKNLDSSEKFYIGGASGIRAYPTNEGGGADAHMVNFELRQRLPEGFTLIGFFDYGRVLANHDNHFSGSAVPNGYDLKG
ncbi:MAG: ShlB/FhaC/HecB family hemolysin secretion/activation protein, partial [Rhodospirillaceae bacterium]